MAEGELLGAPVPHKLNEDDPDRARWQYKVIYYSPMRAALFTEIFEVADANGWEVLSTFPAPHKQTGVIYRRSRVARLAMTG